MQALMHEPTDEQENNNAINSYFNCMSEQPMKVHHCAQDKDSICAINLDKVKKIICDIT